ncbi:hypothetical protein GW915_09115 [bacterium]|nr:hypothetical protein [bacterium]
MKGVYWRWTVLFILLNLSIPKVGGPNPYSRLAQLASMAEDGSFAIDFQLDEINWTNDWAQSSDGARFSNKAPGPAFIAFPLYKVMDFFQTMGEASKKERFIKRWNLKHLNGGILSLVFQVLLTALLMFFIDQSLVKNGISQGAREFLLLAVYFASISSVFMNTFFGHALAATLVLGSVYFFERKKYFFVGLWSGLALLSDYSAGIFLILLLPVIVWQNRRNLSACGRVGAGAFLPFVLWAYYHISAFGGLLSLPLAHQNPDFITDESAEGLSGVLSMLPNPRALLGLLFGGSRGLLMSSPWVLLLVVMGFKELFKISNLKFDGKASLFLGVAFFSLLLLFNSAFGAWEAGASPGARYLSIAMPLLAYVMISGEFLSEKFLRLARWLLFPSLLFFCCVYATTLLLPAEALWPLFVDRIFYADRLSALYRLVFLLLSFGVVFVLGQRERRVS